MKMSCCHSDEDKVSPPRGAGARKVTDYEAVPVQIGFVYYPEFHHFQTRAYTLLIL